MDFIKNEYFIYGIIIFNFILLILLICNIIKTNKIGKKYKEFMRKIGNGKDLEEDLENYIHRVERVEKQNGEIVQTCNEMSKSLEKCIQKVGVVRYNAFENTGSDLSFALALLDNKDNGIVLNGIFSRESSNLYAKPVISGKSSYSISEEEEKAIEKAIQGKI